MTSRGPSIQLRASPDLVQGKYQIEKTFYDTETQEVSKEKEPQIEEITINSQEDLVSLIEKIGQENSKDKSLAIQMRYPFYTQRKLIKL